MSFTVKVPSAHLDHILNHPFAKSIISFYLFVRPLSFSSGKTSVSRSNVPASGCQSVFNIQQRSVKLRPSLWLPAIQICAIGPVVGSFPFQQRIGHETTNLQRWFQVDFKREFRGFSIFTSFPGPRGFQISQNLANVGKITLE